MLIKRKKVIIGTCLLLGILLSILGCAGIKMMTPQKQRYPQGAQRSIVVTIDTSQRDEFFDQLRKFAEKHDFTILIDVGPRSNEDFHIEMNRGDIEIIGDNPFDPGEYGFGFYHADLLHPALDSAFDDLISDLESFINEVTGATFSVEQ